MTPALARDRALAQIADWQRRGLEPDVAGQAFVDAQIVTADYAWRWCWSDVQRVMIRWDLFNAQPESGPARPLFAIPKAA